MIRIHRIPELKILICQSRNLLLIKFQGILKILVDFIIGSDNLMQCFDLNLDNKGSTDCFLTNSIILLFYPFIESNYAIL